ncbi:hypothetical protein BV20DRAFT_1038757 [Pilatotrama ljubarskyi]|nr:hypothetical protein BV20DRAFT_1038757 [Pilatotrama ljubarskyi]
MSTTSLPAYAASFARIPSYSAEPQEFEQRLALNRPPRRPVGDFVKQSRGGNVSLRLFSQEDNVSLPVYGYGAAVEGTVNLSKTDGVSAVEVKIEGSLRIREVAEGGTTTHKLCLSKVTLWSKDVDEEPCPHSLKFSLTLPTTFSDGKDTYPLPPTHDVHLSGVPGFNATIEYGVSATVVKGKASALLRIGNSRRLMITDNSTVSTPFIYYPRSRPALPLPESMSLDTLFSIDSPDWRCWESSMKARLKGGKDIHCQLYMPASRVFSIAQPIPFHIMFSSSALSLAAYLPYGPTANILAPNKQFTHLRVIRQSVVDVRNAIVLGTKTDMWRVDVIGEAEFRHSGDGPDWLAFAGEITIDEQVKVGGFKASGLTVKDFIELSMMPPDPPKAPFTQMRLVIPIRLTTDPWSMDDFVLAVAEADLSSPSTPAAAEPQ